MKSFLYFMGGLVGALIFVPILIILMTKYIDWLTSKFK